MKVVLLFIGCLVCIYYWEDKVWFGKVCFVVVVIKISEIIVEVYCVDIVWLRVSLEVGSWSYREV